MAGVFRYDGLRGKTELSQEDINYWCEQCRFSYEGKRCQEKLSIQRCWDEWGAVAGKWHLRHECPFLYLGKPCGCNRYKSSKRAKIFADCGLDYSKVYKWDIEELDFVFLSHLLQALGKAEVEPKRRLMVTAGPYRMYDVHADFSEEGVVKIDFYSVIRMDSRLDEALRWAVKSIELDKPANEEEK